MTPAADGDFWLYEDPHVQRLYHLRVKEHQVDVASAMFSTSGYIWAFEVAESWRRKGYGSRLLELLIREARRQGHPWVRLRVHVDNERAHAFYSKHRFYKSGMHGVDARGEWTELELEINEAGMGEGTPRGAAT